MGNMSVPSSLSGSFSGTGAPAGNTAGVWGAGQTPGQAVAKTPLATAQQPAASQTAQPSFVSAGMSGLTGVPEYISNWLAQGGKGVNPADPNTMDDPTAGGELTVGSAAPELVNNIRQYTGRGAANAVTGSQGMGPKVRTPAATLPAAPGAVTRPPGQAPGVPGGAPGTPGAAPGATPGAPGATPGAPGATPGGSIYDPRYGAAPALDPKVSGGFGVKGPAGNYTAPTAQDMEGVTDQQLQYWLQNGGGQGDTRAILGPEQAWMAQGKYADPASIRAYAMWRLGMGNGLAASSNFQQPQQQQPRWGS